MSCSSCRTAAWKPSVSRWAGWPVRSSAGAALLSVTSVSFEAKRLIWVIKDWHSTPAASQLVHLPANERVDVVFLALRQRTGLVADRFDPLLLPAANLPVLL